MEYKLKNITPNQKDIIAELDAKRRSRVEKTIKRPLSNPEWEKFKQLSVAKQKTT